MQMRIVNVKKHVIYKKYVYIFSTPAIAVVAIKMTVALPTLLPKINVLGRRYLAWNTHTSYERNPRVLPLFFAVRMRPWRIFGPAPVNSQKAVMA